MSWKDFSKDGFFHLLNLQFTIPGKIASNFSNCLPDCLLFFTLLPANWKNSIEKISSQNTTKFLEL